MVLYNPKDWFSLIFHFHKSDTFRKMFLMMIIFAIYTGIVVYVELHHRDWFQFKSTIQIHSLLGFVLGLLLVFRTNTAYDRWWEGRRHWGVLVNNTRNLAMKFNAILKTSEERKYWSSMISNYAFAVKEHLRDGVIFKELDLSFSIDPERIKNAAHVPNAIANEMYETLQKMFDNKVITGEQLIVFDKEIKSFTDILGGCERIKNTPIPYSYSMYLKKFIFIYCLTMPFGMVFDYNYWTIPIVTVILYVLASLELIAEEIEDPFGDDTNDLPVNILAEKIKVNVKELLIRE